MISNRFALGWAIAAGILCAALTSAGAAESEPARSDMAMPSTPPAMAIGGHARGCLAGAVPLPLDGPGYQVMRSSRNRFYGHPVAVDFVRQFATAMRAKGWDGLLLVGDLGQPRGGPMGQGHRSHQTGLDIDVWFQPASRRLSPQEREEMAAISMVDEQGTAVIPLPGRPARSSCCIPLPVFRRSTGSSSTRRSSRSCAPRSAMTVAGSPRSARGGATMIISMSAWAVRKARPPASTGSRRCRRGTAATPRSRGGFPRRRRRNCGNCERPRPGR